MVLQTERYHDQYSTYQEHFDGRIKDGYNHTTPQSQHHQSGQFTGGGYYGNIASHPSGGMQKVKFEKPECGHPPESGVATILLQNQRVNFEEPKCSPRCIGGSILHPNPGGVGVRQHQSYSIYQGYGPLHVRDGGYNYHGNHSNHEVTGLPNNGNYGYNRFGNGQEYRYTPGVIPYGQIWTYWSMRSVDDE